MTRIFSIPAAAFLGLSLAHAQPWLYEEVSPLSAPAQVDSATMATPAPWVGKEIPVQDSVPASAPVSATPAQPVAQTVKDSAIKDSAVAPPPVHGKGAVRGIVIASDGGKPLDKAIIVMKLDTMLLRSESDANGMFLVPNVAPGTWQVRISRKGFATLVKDRVLVKSGPPSLDEYSLDRRVAQGRVMEVAKPRATGAADMANKRQNSAAVMEGVTAEQIAKSTDSDAGAIARRVTGTSLVGGKYVYVRGLGERYTNMTLNGLPVPTPEKDKRVVPQDLFPASALESFAIYKSWTPDLPPDFAGGSVALETKGIPEKDFFKVSVGTGSTDYVGDKGFLVLGKSRFDMQTDNGMLSYLGFQTPSMERPAGVPDVVSSFTQPDPETRGEIAGKWNNKWSLDTTTIMPDQSISINYGRNFKPKEGTTAGYIASANFKNRYYEEDRERIKVLTNNVSDSIQIERRGNLFWVQQSVYDTVDGEPVPMVYLIPGLLQDWKVGGYETSTSLLLDGGWEDRDNKWWSKNMYAALSEQTARYYSSYAVPGLSTGQSNPTEERMLTDFSRRSIAVSQVGGGHYIGYSVLDSLSWAAGIAHSGGESPDAKKWYYVRDDSTTISWETKAPWGTRQFQEFGETGIAGRTDFYLIVPPELSERDIFREEPGWLSRIKLPKAKVGVQGDWKTRSFNMNTYIWDALPLSRDTTLDYSLVDRVMNPDSVAAMVARGDTRFLSFLGDYDTYEAQEAKGSVWLGMEQEFNLWNRPVMVTLGGRSEWYYLDFIAPFTSEAAVTNPALRLDSAETIDRLDWSLYPSAGLSFEFWPRTKTRLLFAQTLVRPEFRERLPTTFWDADEGIEVIGNPDLKDTRITHWDWRFEWYLPQQQMLSASLFRKDFENPVEALVNASVQPDRREFQNAKGAWVQGVELEADLSASRWVKGLSVYANAAWMASEVRIDQSQSGAELLTSSKRPLVGQSPWLYNTKLTHEVEFGSKQSVMNALLYNVAGRRIRALGTEEVPDIYEEAFHALDYMLRYKLGDMQWTFRAKNLLNSVQRQTVTEFHQNESYEVISDEERDRLYANSQLQDVITVSRRAPGISYAISMDWSL